MKTPNGYNVLLFLLLFLAVISLQNSTADEQTESKAHPEFYTDFIQDLKKDPHKFPFGNHCKKTELTVFSCKMKDENLLSICVSAKEERPYISYRFGQLHKLEFIFPKEQSTQSLEQFTYNWYTRGMGCENEGLDLNYLSFPNKSYRYTVYTEYSACEEKTVAGVRIDKLVGSRETEIADLKCESFTGSLLEFRFQPIVRCPQCEIE